MNTAMLRGDFLADALIGSAQRAAVVDIGSNSVRLVIFDGSPRMPPYFNEKVFCAIGRDLGTTGRLDEEGVTRALDALSRFRGIIATARCSRVEAVATAAVRDAVNGHEFVAHATDAFGYPIRILSGEEEARLSAIGVLCGIPNADGVVGDLGGGSLELVRVKGGAIEKTVSLPLGPLRLMDASLGSMKAARQFVDDQISKVKWLKTGAARNLYLVGGAWRNLARINMEREDYPVRILHQYAMPHAAAVKIARTIQTQSKKSLEQTPGISRKRLEGLPHAALVLERLLLVYQAPSIVVSAFGLREGVLADALGEDAGIGDPMLTYARATCERMARDPAFCAELVDWTAPLFPWETNEQRRLREGACWLSDVVWRAHPDYRGELIFSTVMAAQIAGLDHQGRAFLATTLHTRYPDGPRSPLAAPVSDRILPQAERDRARVLGEALRLGVSLSGASAGTLPLCPFQLKGDTLQLHLPRNLRPLLGEVADKRLQAVAEALRLSRKITLI